MVEWAVGQDLGTPACVLPAPPGVSRADRGHLASLVTGELGLQSLFSMRRSMRRPRLSSPPVRVHSDARRGFSALQIARAEIFRMPVFPVKQRLGMQSGLRWLPLSFPKLDGSGLQGGQPQMSARGCRKYLYTSLSCLKRNNDSKRNSFHPGRVFCHQIN